MTAFLILLVPSFLAATILFPAKPRSTAAKIAQQRRTLRRLYAPSTWERLQRRAGAQLLALLIRHTSLRRRRQFLLRGRRRNPSPTWYRLTPRPLRRYAVSFQLARAARRRAVLPHTRAGWVISKRRVGPDANATGHQDAPAPDTGDIDDAADNDDDPRAEGREKNSATSTAIDTPDASHDHPSTTAGIEGTTTNARITRPRTPGQDPDESQPPIDYRTVRSDTVTAEISPAQQNAHTIVDNAIARILETWAAPMSDQQRGFLSDIAKAAGGELTANLTKRQASSVIESVKASLLAGFLAAKGFGSNRPNGNGGPAPSDSSEDPFANEQHGPTGEPIVTTPAAPAVRKNNPVNTTDGAKLTLSAITHGGSVSLGNSGCGVQKIAYDAVMTKVLEANQDPNVNPEIIAQRTQKHFWNGAIKTLLDHPGPKCAVCASDLHPVGTVVACRSCGVFVPLTPEHGFTTTATG